MKVRQMNAHTPGVALLIVLVALLATQGGASDDDTAYATLAAGCFWCIEADLEKVEGVL